MASKFLTATMISASVLLVEPAFAQIVPSLERLAAPAAVREAPLSPIESLKQRAQGTARDEVAPQGMATDSPERDDTVEGVTEEAATLGQVAWVLVIQAGRGPKGELVPWEKEGAWAKAWRVPGDAGGTRFVPVFGDAEDRERVRPADARHLAGLSFLAAKYKAPAIAVVVREADAVGVTGWRSGATSGWSSVAMPAAASADDAKAAAVRLIAGVFPAHRGREPDVAAANARMKARVLAFRDVGETTRQYQVVVEGKGAAQVLQRKIESVQGLSISEIMTTPEGYDVVLDDRSGSTEPVEKRLSEAGLPTTAQGRR